MNRWEHFEHQADIGVRGFGASRGEAFAEAALALTAVVADVAAVVPLVPLEVVCEAPDDEQLLVEWLNRVIYEMATRRMLFSRYDVYVGAGQLKARLWGEPVEPERHRSAVEVKAATYHGLAVRQQPDGLWMAQCVVDV